jgi:hypothetical protein
MVFGRTCLICIQKLEKVFSVVEKRHLVETKCKFTLQVNTFLVPVVGGFGQEVCGVPVAESGQAFLVTFPILGLFCFVSWMTLSTLPCVWLGKL